MEFKRQNLDANKFSELLFREFKENLPFVNSEEKKAFIELIKDKYKEKYVYETELLKNDILDNLNWEGKMYLNWDKFVLLYKPKDQQRFEYYKELGFIKKNLSFYWDPFEKILKIRKPFPQILKEQKYLIKRQEEYIVLEGKKEEMVIRFLPEEEVIKKLNRYFFDKLRAFEKEISNDSFVQSICKQQTIALEYSVVNAIKNYITSK